MVREKNMKKNKDKNKQEIREPLPTRIFHGLNYILIAGFALLCFYPMWYCFAASVSEPTQLMKHVGPLLLPEGFTLDAYGKVFQNPNIFSGYKNTLIVLFVGVALNIIMTSIGAYVLSRKTLYWRKPLMIFIMITMFFSGGLIPTYLNMKQLYLTDTLWGLMVPFAINTFNLIILKTSFESIPDSLIEAAEIDGANHLTILYKVVLPLSKATLAVMVLYYGVEKWNGWFWASCIIRNRELLPLQVILREILLSSTQSMTGGAGGDTEAIGITIRYATTLVATLPILCVYPFIQKYFTKGVMIGAVKE